MFFLIFFFSFCSSNMLTDTIVPWHWWQPPAHLHTITTPILHPSDMATWRRAGGLETWCISSPRYVFFFIYYYYIFSMEWAYEWPERDGNGRGSRCNMSWAPGMFFCITFNCVFKTTNPIELANRYGRAKMRWKQIWLGTRVAKCLKPQVHFYIY